MTMLSGGSAANITQPARAAHQNAARRLAHANRFSRWIHPHLLLAAIGMIGALVLVQFISGTWKLPWPTAPAVQVEPDSPAKSPAAAVQKAPAISISDLSRLRNR